MQSSFEEGKKEIIEAISKHGNVEEKKRMTHAFDKMTKQWVILYNYKWSKTPENNEMIKKWKLIPYSYCSELENYEEEYENFESCIKKAKVITKDDGTFTIEGENMEEKRYEDSLDGIIHIIGEPVPEIKIRPISTNKVKLARYILDQHGPSMMDTYKNIMGITMTDYDGKLHMIVYKHSSKRFIIHDEPEVPSSINIVLADKTVTTINVYILYRDLQLYGGILGKEKVEVTQDDLRMRWCYELYVGSSIYIPNIYVPKTTEYCKDNCTCGTISCFLDLSNNQNGERQYTHMITSGHIFNQGVVDETGRIPVLSWMGKKYNSVVIGYLVKKIVNAETDCALIELVDQGSLSKTLKIQDNKEIYKNYFMPTKSIDINTQGLKDYIIPSYICKQYPTSFYLKEKNHVYTATESPSISSENGSNPKHTVVYARNGCSYTNGIVMNCDMFIRCYKYNDSYNGNDRYKWIRGNAVIDPGASWYPRNLADPGYSGTLVWGVDAHNKNAFIMGTIVGGFYGITLICNLKSSLISLLPTSYPKPSSIEFDTPPVLSDVFIFMGM